MKHYGRARDRSNGNGNLVLPSLVVLVLGSLGNVGCWRFGQRFASAASFVAGLASPRPPA